MTINEDGVLLRIFAGERRLIGMITEVESQSDASAGAIARVDIMGEIVSDEKGRDRFKEYDVFSLLHYDE